MAVSLSPGRAARVEDECSRVHSLKRLLPLLLGVLPQGDEVELAFCYYLLSFALPGSLLRLLPHQQAVEVARRGNTA